MSRLIVLALLLAPAFPARSAVVVEKLSLAPVTNAALAPGVALSAAPGIVPSLSVSPALSAPALPSPFVYLFPAGKPVAAAPALAARPLSAPASSLRARGPPTARDRAFSAAVAETVAETVRSWGVPSEEILQEHDALLVGESHHSLASVDELARNLPALAKAGVKVVGIEGLKRPSQDSVDDFVSRRTETLPLEALDFSPARREAFAGLLRAARATGVRVVALGLPLDGWSREAAELAAKKTGDPVESFLGTPGEQLYRAQRRYEPGYNEAVAEVYLKRRNESMATFLVSAMSAGVKAVVLVGQAHVEGDDKPSRDLMRAPGDWGTLGKELARLGLKAFSLTLTGGLYTDYQSSVDDRAARPAAHAHAVSASPGGAPAYKPTGRSTGVWHAGGRVPKSALIAH